MRGHKHLQTRQSANQRPRVAAEPCSWQTHQWWAAGRWAQRGTRRRDDRPPSGKVGSWELINPEARRAICQASCTFTTRHRDQSQPAHPIRRPCSPCHPLRASKHSPAGVPVGLLHSQLVKDRPANHGFREGGHQDGPPAGRRGCCAPTPDSPLPVEEDFDVSGLFPLVTLHLSVFPGA
jgi:hypothetical protein